MNMAEASLKAVEISAARAAEMLSQPLMTTIRWALYEFAGKGLAPLMFDRMTKEEIRSIKTKQKVNYPTDEPFEVVAARKLYSDEYDDEVLTRTPKGKCVIPGDNLFAALRDAGTDVQYGSGQYDKVTLSSKGTMFNWMVHIQQPCFEVLGFDGKAAKWVVDVRKGNATQGSGACCIIRPRFDEWGFAGHLLLNIDLLSEANLKKLFTIAGMKCGLCSARPGKKMNFGLFALTWLKWIGGADPKSAAAISVAPAAKRGGRGKKAVSPATPPAESNGDSASE